MKQLRKDIIKELLKFHNEIESSIKASESKILKEPTAEEAFKTTLIKLEEVNEKLNKIMNRYQERFEKIEELIEYFENNE